MNKLKINYLIDLLMAIFFLGTAISGLVLFFFLPAGQRRGGYQEFLGILKHNWVNFHNWCGVILTFLVLIHLILHLKWILGMTRNFFQKRIKN